MQITKKYYGEGRKLVNISYLMQYVSRSLHTIVRRYDNSKVNCEEICCRNNFSDTAYLGPCGDEKFSIPELLLDAPDDNFPKIYTGSNFVTYSSVKTDHDVFIVGPVVLNGNTKSDFLLPARCYDSDWLISLYHCETEELVNILLLLHNLFHKEIRQFHETAAFNCLTEADIDDVIQTYSGIIFDNIETSTRHNPYDQEIREVASIRNGDLEQLKKSWEEDYIGKIGKMAKTKLRSYQNVAIVLVTLGSRAAMEAGVHPEIAYSLSDSYVQKIEEVNNPVAAIQLGKKAEYQYATLVHGLKTKKENRESGFNQYIDKCKDYIFAHLHDKIRIPEIAEALFLNPNYLSNLFKKEVGMTITEYIWQEKLKLVKNMLIYSPYSQNEIAAYLGFSSQSHLGRQFKKETGMTLNEYREKYGVREFSE